MAQWSCIVTAVAQVQSLAQQLLLPIKAPHHHLKKKIGQSGIKGTQEFFALFCNFFVSLKLFETEKFM